MLTIHKPNNNVFTRATRSIVRYMLRQRGWLGGCHTPVLYQNG